jgi:hypothetical protein
MVEKKQPTLGAEIDALWQLRQKIKKANAATKVLEDQEEAAELALLGRFGDSELGGAKGKFATASILRHTIASITDWPTLTKWIKKSGRFEILQKRISTTTLNELLEEHKQVPGVEPGVKKSIGLTTHK